MARLDMQESAGGRLGAAAGLLLWKFQFPELTDFALSRG